MTTEGAISQMRKPKPPKEPRMAIMAARPAGMPCLRSQATGGHSTVHTMMARTMGRPPRHTWLRMCQMTKAAAAIISRRRHHEARCLMPLPMISARSMWATGSSGCNCSKNCAASNCSGISGMVSGVVDWYSLTSLHCGKKFTEWGQPRVCNKFAAMLVGAILRKFNPHERSNWPLDC